MDDKKSYKNKRNSIIFIIVFIIIILICTILLMPLFTKLLDEKTRLNLENKINNLGVLGWLLVLLLQILQVVISFIPSEMVEMIAGAIYGPIGGLLTCVLGIIISAILMYFFAKHIGKKFIKNLLNTKKYSKYKFLNNKTNLEITIFIVFFIPPGPKDIFLYLSPFLPISPVRFILISTIARIPAILTSTVIGDQIIKGEYQTATIIFAGSLVISVLTIFINNWYINKKEKLNIYNNISS